ncbi:MAG TPA: TetR/AcrR family transcriptional regulator [Firmicutes bacterium]|nr:TetR/AcrR family transcriptional regulator [Bacillota bacterium]
MARARLSPERRRAEILAAARKLIAEKGFAGMAVSDLVKTVGVAQGTFYWYFTSKEELLDAVTEEIVREVVEALEAVAGDHRLGAVEKLERMNEIFLAYVSREKAFLRDFHDPRNGRLHSSVNKEATKRLMPAVASVIRQGIAEGAFDTRYPQEAAGFIVAATQAVTACGTYGQEESLTQRGAALMDFILKGLGFCADRSAGQTPYRAVRG